MPTPSHSSLRFIDLFAGAGGLSVGLSQAGFNGLMASELQPAYAKTYAHNHAQTLVEVGDIRALDASGTMERLGLKRGDLALLAGGPPCQGFSINAPRRSTEDQRNHLFREFLRFAETLAPRAVLIENVPGLVSFERGATLQAILDSLTSLGYRADVRILGAAYYGVPQTRWRTIIVGFRDGENPEKAFPHPVANGAIRTNFTTTFGDKQLVHNPIGKGMRAFTTVEEAIGDLPPLANGERGATVKPYPSKPMGGYQEAARQNSDGIRNHEAPRLSDINLARLAHIAPGGNWTAIPEALLPEGMQRARRSDHTMRYGRVRPDGLASTILTKCDPHWGAYFHYAQARAFTVREAARIQSFPDRFQFLGTMAEQYAQVGNAVPPLLAKAIGEAMKRILEDARSLETRCSHSLQI